MKNIKDWNSNEVANNEIFHFKNSLRPFISIQDCDGKYLFIDIDEGIGYGFNDLETQGLEFYTDKTEEDPNFMGVEVDGKLRWVE